MFDGAYPISLVREEASTLKNMKERHIPPKVIPNPGILILAVGNPLRGDDGIGAAIIDILAKMTTLPSHATLMDGGIGGIKITQWIQGYQQVIIIDAVDFAGAPGDWMRFSLEDVLLLSERENAKVTFHHADLRLALELGHVLNILPNKIMIYAIQPESLGWSSGLSRAVQKAIPEICESILNDIQVNQ